MSCCSVSFTSSVSASSPPSPHSIGNGLSALQTCQVSSHLRTTCNDLPRIFPWLPPSHHSALNLYHLLREGQRCCWRPCPYAPPQGVHPSPRCCGCWLLLAQASVLSCGTALGLQEPPPLALVQEIMAVTYTSPLSRRPGQRLSDERISSLHFWWLRWQRIHLQWRKPQFDPWVGKIPGWREWQPTPVFLPGESHGQRSLVGYSPQGHKEMDTTEQLTQDMTPLGGVIHDSGLPVGSSWDQTSPKATSLLNFIPCCLLLFFPLPKRFLLRIF